MKRVFLFLVLLLSACQAPTGGWRDDLKSSAKKPMLCPPTASFQIQKDEARVLVKNNSSTPVLYWGRGKTHPVTLSERRVLWRWIDDEWDWCGTGTMQYELKPGEAVEFRMLALGGARREYAIFTSIDGKNEALVLLCSTE